MEVELAQRLRDLRDRQQWTVAEMAYRTGLPKRTLDKYMLREGASLPGFEALTAMSKGLGVSLDWLVFGSEPASSLASLIAQRASTEVSRAVFEAMHRMARTKEQAVQDGDRLFGMYPEQWAAEVGHRVKDQVAGLVASGETHDTLSHWIGRDNERQSELTSELIELMRSKTASRHD